MKEMLDTVPRKSQKAVFRKIGEECIVVPVASSVADVNSIFSLNETGAAIWDLIDGKRNIRDIVSGIEGEFEAEGQQVEADVFSLIQEMVEAKLIEV